MDEKVTTNEQKVTSNEEKLTSNEQKVSPPCPHNKDETKLEIAVISSTNI